MQRLAGILLLVLAATGAARAGDSATFSAFGYSEDRRYFAYEELSIGDEGTAPYATVKVVDLTTGELALGSPWTATSGEDGGKSISQLRLEALEMGGAALAEANPGDPAHFLALIGDGVRDSGERLVFALPQGADPDALGPDTILDVVPLPSFREDRCTPDFGGGSFDIVLMLSAEGTIRQLRNNAVVGGDECIRRYRLYGVMQPYNGGDIETLVAVLSIYTVGFEGYDRRFLVIPLGSQSSP